MYITSKSTGMVSYILPLCSILHCVPTWRQTKKAQVNWPSSQCQALERKSDWLWYEELSCLSVLQESGWLLKRQWRYMTIKGGSAWLSFNGSESLADSFTCVRQCLMLGRVQLTLTLFSVFFILLQVQQKIRNIPTDLDSVYLMKDEKEHLISK